MSSIQRPLTDEEQLKIGLVTKHDTPQSPHREHMTGGKGGGGSVKTNQRVAEGLAEIAGNTTREHRVEQVSEFAAVLEGANPQDTRGTAEQLAEIAGNTTHEHREEQIQQFQRHLAEEGALPEAGSDPAEGGQPSAVGQDPEDPHDPGDVWTGHAGYQPLEQPAQGPSEEGGGDVSPRSGRSAPQGQEPRGRGAGEGGGRFTRRTPGGGTRSAGRLRGGRGS